MTQAHALGVTPPPVTNAFGVALSTLGNTSGPVLSVGADTIPQLIAYIAATDGNTDTSTALAAASPSATQGASAIGRAQAQRLFVDAMASFSPNPAVASDAWTGVHTPNSMPGLVASARSFRPGAHVMLA